jgi:hypothetical protein
MIKKIFLYAFVSVILAAISVSADEYRDKVNKGYEYYRNGEYDKASDNFTEAGVLKPEEALPNFNKGSALYRSNNFTIKLIIIIISETRYTSRKIITRRSNLILNL